LDVKGIEDGLTSLLTNARDGLFVNDLRQLRNWNSDPSKAALPQVSAAMQWMSVAESRADLPQGDCTITVANGARLERRSDGDPWLFGCGGDLSRGQVGAVIVPNGSEREPVVPATIAHGSKRTPENPRVQLIASLEDYSEPCDTGLFRPPRLVLCA
jgi:hypothetical protein